MAATRALARRGLDPGAGAVDRRGRLEARKEPYQGYAYASARVNTRSRFEFLYGRVEVRARLPAGRGAWPACGEVDITEDVGFDPLRIQASVRTAAYNHMAGTQKTTDVTIASPAQDFHVYAMEWHTDKMLRVYFLHHRELLGELSQAAAETARELLAAAADGGEGISARSGLGGPRERRRSCSGTRCWGCFAAGGC